MSRDRSNACVLAALGLGGLTLTLMAAGCSSGSARATGDAAAEAASDASAPRKDAPVKPDAGSDAGAPRSDASDGHVCANACTPGETTCLAGGLAGCVRGSEGCTEWGSPSPCASGEACQRVDAGAACTCNPSECTQAGAVCNAAAGILTRCMAGSDGCLVIQSSVVCATTVANATASCADGGCTYRCEATFHDCSGACVSDTSVQGCGSSCAPCPTPANASPTCASTGCGYACVAPFLDCDGNALNGCEVDGATDPTNCGACGMLCSYPNAVAACAGGQCGLSACSAGYLDCDGSSANGCEVDAQTDANNCGACGKKCELGEGCSAGACTTTYTSGLIGYWDMDDGAGAGVAHDSSGNGLTGSLIGGVSFAPGQGKQGTGAASFNGSSYIDVLFPNDAKGQGAGVAMPQGNVTYAMWFKTSAAAVQGLQVVEGSTWGGGCDRVVGNGAGTTLNYNAWSEQNPAGQSVVTNGAWHHFAYVMDETNGLMAYVDGVSDLTAADTSATNCGVGCSGFNWASDYWIGTGGGCRYGAGGFVGLIDEVRVYNYPLTAAQVAGLYGATK